MRVPTQRASRSGSATSATTPGKRISSSSSASTVPSSGGVHSVKKRKLQPDTGTTVKSSGADTAASSKKKVSGPLTKKPVVKKGETGGGMKTSTVLTKKLTPRKTTTTVLSVGLKRSKTQLKKIPSRKISVVTIASKAHKKIVKSVKTLAAKKHMSIGKKGNSSAAESGAGASSGEERVKASDTTSEDVPPQKRPPGRPPLNKDTLKTAKANARKPKANALVTVSSSINSAKKLAQQKNISLKKSSIKKQTTVSKNTTGVQENHQHATTALTEEKKKGKVGRKKSAGMSTESPEEKSADKSPDIKDTEESSEEKESAESDSQNADKPSGKVSVKKTKEEEAALKTKTKKKLKKKKPKIEAESISKEEEEEEASVVISETAKENKDNTPKKDNKELPSGKLKSELLRKKQNSKLNESSGKKTESSKKTLVSKPMKIVSTKVKKTTLSNPKSSDKKKLQVKAASAKEQVKPVIKKESIFPNVTDKKCSSDNGEDSSTSDEITLDMLMRQHLMKQEVFPKRDPVPADASIVVRSHSDCGDSVSSPASTRHDDSVSRMSEIVSSPMTITSDEEDLKTMKNRIKVKMEKNEERTSPLLTKSDQQVSSKDKENDSYKAKVSAKKDIKDEKSESKKSSQDSDEEKPKAKKMIGVNKSPTGVKRIRGEGGKGGNGSDTEQRARRMKLFGFWSGPKRHRVASLNALAKVHCLYENESRGALYALCSASQISSSSKSAKSSTTQASKRTNTSTSEAPTSTTTTTTTSTRTLRSAPGLRGMGKHWDMHNASSTSSSSTSSSDENDSGSDSPAHTRPSATKPKVQRPASKVTLKKNTKQLKNVKKVVRRRRNKCELMMDLKDMVVRKRMASLNASAILAASYSMEKRSPKVAKEEGSTEADSNVKKKKKRVVTKKIVEVEEDTTSTVMSEVEVEECGSSRSVIEVRTTPSNSSNKVAVIVNQDTDVTITGVYVNSTTRSTHHEGYCSIAGMQYRISSTSHTQTEATAVATETVLHTSTAAEHPTTTQHPAEPPLAMPMKSYTPLGALSSMQPPGAPVSGGPAPHHHHLHPHPHPHPHPPCNVPPQQPPPPPPPPHRGAVNPPPISPLGRRHGCTSAFSAPPSATYGPPPPPPPPPQHHQQPPPHHHPPHPPPPPQGQQDPGYIHGYYQPAGPLISTHHHHHSSSSSSTSATNAGKAVLPTLEASPNPTPPPQPQPPQQQQQQQQQQPPNSSSSTTTPQQIVSVTSASGGGDESSDNDVIITATSCSGGGETHPPPPPHHPPYRYPQSYPTPSTPQHIHHQSYTYNYPHTQYYPSPPASASIQYSTNPPGLQQHHHYHNQDLCYSSGTPSYPPASYFHHKSYSTPPPPPTFHRRYIQQPPSHQYYPPDLYAAPASNGSQQSSAQSQQSQQQMVVTGSATGSASSYQLGVSSNPPLVETYPPPVSIVDPYPPPPGYYAGYSAGPGAAGCYSHSPPTRSLAFIDAAAYQTCPCPMQSCPKNVHTGPLTGDGKGPHLASKQNQPPPQESGASFHQLPLPPVALALPLEPPGALGPPSPARGSAGMPPPPSPATASARNPSHTQERSWESSNQQEVSSPEPKVSETQLKSSVEVPQELQNKPDNTTLPSEEARHRLLTISNIVPKPEAVVCRTKSKKRRSPPAADTAKSDNSVPLLMCDHEFRKKRQNSSDIVVTKVDEVTILDTDLVCDSVKTELKEIEKDTITKPQTEKEVADCLKVDQSDEKATPRKRKMVEPASETAKTDNEAIVPKRRKPSNVGVITNGLLAPGKDSAKTLGTETQEEVVKTPTSQTKCKNAQKSQPLSSNSSLHNSKQQVRKRKLDDTRDLAENKEPQLSAPAKKKSTTKAVKLQNTQTKIYPSRVIPPKKVSLKIGEVPKRVEEMVNSALAKNRTVLEPLANTKRNNGSNLTAVNKKNVGSKNVERKKTETRINGTLPCSKKALQKLHTTKVQDTVNSVDAAKSRASHCTSSRAAVEVKKGQHKKKSENVEVLSTRKSRATNSLRSQLRDSLSDQTSSDDSESLPPKGKSSLVVATRRTSSGSRKEQIKTSVKKPGSVMARNDGHKKLQQSQEQQMDPEDKTNQEASQILAALSRRSVPKKTLQMPKWSNGWKFEGRPFENRVFLSSDDVSVIRKCYPLMRHEEGDVICPRDCILLKSGPRKTDLPFVAKVAALWENPEDGEMMVSLLWYYRPEHTDHGRRPDDMEDEIFASKHKDINSVACIEDKCYVLTFNEYCRYRKCVRRIEDGVKEPGLVVPQHEDYPREGRQPPGCVAPDLVFFCRRVYDFRQRRILKNPG